MTKLRSFFYLILFLLVLLILRFCIGQLFPYLPNGSDIWFASGLLLIILGIFITEKYFTKSLDVIVNIITLLIVLWTIDSFKLFLLYPILLGYTILIGLIAIISFLVFDDTKDPHLWHQIMAKSFNSVATFLGSSKILFSIMFLLSLFNYLVFSSLNEQLITQQQIAILCLIIFWGATILIEPIDRKIIQPLIDFFFGAKSKSALIGSIVTRMSPNILIVTNNGNSILSLGELAIIDNYSSNHKGDKAIAMYLDGLESENKKYSRFYLIDGTPKDIGRDIHLYSLEDDNKEDVKKRLSSLKIYKYRNNLVGTVYSHSDIDVIKIKMISGVDSEKKLEEGDLLYVDYYDQSIKYQIINVETDNENVDGQNKKGIKIITAQQIGYWIDETQRFANFNWVPDINALVFIESRSDAPIKELGNDYYRIGVVPKSPFPIYINLDDSICHHLAIIGKTGTGKSRMAAKMIDKIANDNFKVVIFEVDRTNLQSLSRYIDSALIEAQQTKEFDIAKSQKNIISVIWQTEEKDRGTGTLNISEAASNIIDKIVAYQMSNKDKKVCIVMEEAYDFIPESTFGRQDFGQPKVSRISQQVLKCRKHNIGFLIITQRTALVTKTILYQCHTIIALQSFDETSKTFMSAYISNKYLESMSILPKFRAIVVGKGSTCDKPVIVDFEDKSLH